MNNKWCAQDVIIPFSVLQVGSYVAEKTPAGGHQGYAALGGLYTQARPMCTHLYGPLKYQEQLIPVCT